MGCVGLPRVMTGQFPRWQMVMPTTPAKMTIELDASKLLALLKYAAQFSDDNNKRIRLQLWDEQSSIRLDATNSETQQGMTAVLMPVRRDESKFPYAYGQVAKPEAEVVSATAEDSAVGSASQSS